MTRAGHEIDAVEAGLRRWLEEARYASYDPYDGLSAAVPWSLARRHRLAARILTQVVKASPVNLRPALGIQQRVLVKSLSDLASAALLRHRMGRDPGALSVAHGLLERVRAEVRPGFAGACWALATPYVTRFIESGPGDPNLFWTLNAATAFIEAYELEGQEADLRTARSALEFILHDLGAVDEGEDGVWFRYFVGHDATVYNVAALTGALLQRVARHTHEPDLVRMGARALRFVVRHQNPDGSWYYARGPQGSWVDGFHTGYVLESLLQAALLERDAECEAALRRGLEFYLGKMFTAGDLPRYAADRTFPIEVQNCAQAIQTLARVCWLDRSILERAERVAEAVIRSLFRTTRAEPEPAGYFMLSRGRFLVNSMPAVRWGEAPMLLALTSLQAARQGLPASWSLAIPR